MEVIVDTSVWSSALRRKAPIENEMTELLRKIIIKGNAILLGPIRREILSGIKDQKQFNMLRDKLKSFPDHEITVNDYETAAGFFNLCRGKRIQGSNTDFLICAVASNNKYQVLTSDKDFFSYKKVLDIQLL